MRGRWLFHQSIPAAGNDLISREKIRKGRFSLASNSSGNNVECLKTAFEVTVSTTFDCGESVHVYFLQIVQ